MWELDQVGKIAEVRQQSGEGSIPVGDLRPEKARRGASAAGLGSSSWPAAWAGVRVAARRESPASAA